MWGALTSLKDAATNAAAQVENIIHYYSKPTSYNIFELNQVANSATDLLEKLEDAAAGDEGADDGDLDEYDVENDNGDEVEDDPEVLARATNAIAKEMEAMSREQDTDRLLGVESSDKMRKTYIVFDLL